MYPLPNTPYRRRFTVYVSTVDKFIKLIEIYNCIAELKYDFDKKVFIALVEEVHDDDLLKILNIVHLFNLGKVEAINANENTSKF